MTAHEAYRDLLTKKLLAEFAKRGFIGYYCETREEARQKILAMIPKEALVSCGGSLTLEQVGLPVALKQGGYNFLNPKDASGGAAMDNIAHQALGADYYLMGANAIAATGELVNADGYGNRVSALIFGPKQVIVVAGLNKVAPDLAAALARVKQYAAALGLLAFTPDKYASYDAMMSEAEEICRQTVITSSSVSKGRITVVLIGEELGF